jgi:hypothetical protein
VRSMASSCQDVKVACVLPLRENLESGPMEWPGCLTTGDLGGRPEPSNTPCTDGTKVRDVLGRYRA